MNDRLKYRFWEPEDWHDDKSPLKAVYCNIVDGCDPTIAVSDFEFCTGLKDKNGNLIYEGDVVEITIFGSIGPNGGYVDSDEIYKGTVVWDRDCFLAKTDTDMLLFPHSEDCIEIIGNIHEQGVEK